MRGAMQCHPLDEIWMPRRVYKEIAHLHIWSKELLKIKVMEEYAYIYWMDIFVFIYIFIHKEFNDT